ncbi:MAG: thiol reductant ABC exporter subunit CydD [Acidimicrobiia bacterium]|nr:thiol reductant ABC exporter subunit CydD [Acidimicrobiia bacterium]
MTDTADRRLRPFDRRLLRRVRAVRRVLAVDIAAGLAGTVLLLAQATLLATAVSVVVEPRGHAVAGLLATLAAVVVIRAGLAWTVEVSGRRAATTVMSELRRDLVALRLRPEDGGGRDAPTHEGANSEIVMSAVQGVDGLETYLARYLPQVVLAVTVPVAVLVWSAAVDLTSTLVMLVTLPVVPLFMVLIGRSAAARARANWEALLALSAHFLDVVRGLPTLRAFNRGRAQVTRIAETTDAYRRTTMGTLRLAFLSGLVLDFAATLSTALVAVTLGVRLVGGTLGLRPALTVLLLVPELYAPVRALGTLFHASADGLAATERMLGALDAGDTPREPTAAQPRLLPLVPPAPPVSLRGVTVTFAARSRAALAGVDLEVGPGELVAVLGPSGAGKTTLARVVLGLTQPETGAVEIDGMSPVTCGLDAWRRRLAWLPQHPCLLTAPISDNISLGRPHAGRTEVAEAAKRAGAHEFICRLAQGYDTVVGAGGVRLSPGEQRRVGLARALLRGAPVLVLDEPTAHVDRETARAIAMTLDRLRGTCSTLVITHDSDVAAVADRVVHLEGGCIRTPASGAAAGVAR